jgi:hypothetical protein
MSSSTTPPTHTHTHTHTHTQRERERERERERGREKERENSASVNIIASQPTGVGDYFLNIHNNKELILLIFICGSRERSLRVYESFVMYLT